MPYFADVKRTVSSLSTSGKEGAQPQTTRLSLARFFNRPRNEKVDQGEPYHVVQ